MSDASPVIIRNPSRAIVPAAIALLVLVMFLPPLLLSAFESDEPSKAVFGAALVTLVAGWFAFSAWRAPVEARIADSIVVVRAVRKSHYELSQIRKWFFAVPYGTPTRSSPGTNAVLHLTLHDRTQFRGEVTAEEASRLADRLSHVGIANAIAGR